MIRTIIFLTFICLSLSVWSQDAIRQTDPIPQQKAILVIPGVTSTQLEAIKIEFAKYSQIKQSVYIFDAHNCLLVNLEENEVIRSYSDLMKIIQVATSITEKQIDIKTSAAFTELMPKNLTHESSTYFIVK
jgi:hypothetical protein